MLIVLMTHSIECTHIILLNPFVRCHSGGTQLNIKSAPLTAVRPLIHKHDTEV